MCKNLSRHGLAVKWRVQLFESRPVVMQCVFHVVSHLQNQGSEGHYVRQHNVRQSVARSGLSVQMFLVV